MYNPSNLYAEKIYAEHPIALWALDDAADYISLIDEADRDVTLWDIDAGLAVVYSATDEPFINSQTTKLTGTLTDNDFGQIVCISNNIVNFSTLNNALSTFSIGAFFNSISAYASSFEIGYEYYDTTSGSTIQRLKSYTTSVKDKWFFISETFDIPEDNTEFRIVLKINYIGGASSIEDYEFLVNGVTAGQWCEEFNSTSLGVQKISIPSDISIAPQFAIEASAYGLQDNKAYYLVKDNSLLAKNTGIPLVYGASNLTKLLPNDGEPSLIIPGLGFLSEGGQYKEYTLEAWLRINSDSTSIKRIIGPVGSDDGVYVDGPFLRLKIGSNSGSYYVGEWTRPMLMHVRISENYASMLINGEEVISLNYITSELSLPSKFNSLDKDQDWIGFYAYEDVSPIELDCVAIYTYQVPLVLAKKRFIYGQGVEFPEGINQAYSGSSVYIDYPFADYTNNYSYPNIGKWSQAIVDNLSVEDNLLCTPNYELPEIVLESSEINDLYSELKILQDEDEIFFSFGQSENGYMYFDSLNFLNERMRSFYGSFKFLEEPTTRQILFRIESQSSSDYFEISTINSDVVYTLKYGNADPEVLATFSWSGNDPFAGIALEEMFSAGIDIDKVSKYFGGNVASFFGNINTLKLYIGGKSDLTETFSGKIYKIGFCTERNHKKIEYLFNERGIPVTDENVFELFQETVDVDYNSTDNYFGTNPAEWDDIVDSGGVNSYPLEGFQAHTASYTLSPSSYFDTYTLDIDIQGYWEDYIPLTYFSQYVKDERGRDYYDLDLIQFNINYPAPSVFVEEEQTGSWNYSELYDEYNVPTQRTYSSLDNQLFTGYLNYDDLKNRAYKNYKYDTSKSLVKSYITFQYIQNGANLPESNFVNIECPSNDSFVVPGDEWINTKYEVVNNMIIYPPENVRPLDLAIVTHLDFNVKGILKNKIKVRNLEYASQAFNSTSKNSIGTRFGNEIYPYKKSGFYYDYKTRNPFTIYKGSSPYLYLTRYTGIELKGTYDPLINRGLSIPINKTLAENYKVIALQAAIRYDKDAFPYGSTEIFEIQSRNTHIKFYMVAIHPSGERAKIYAINAKTGRIEDGISFYWNGKLVKEPVITIKEWGFLGVSFPNVLDFRNRVGSINLNGPITFNTISYYQSTNLQEVQQVEIRPWFAVKYAIPLTLEWDYWKSSSFIWNEVLVLASSSYYGVNPETIYKSYTGTNKIIIDSEKVFTVNGYEYNVYKGITSQQTTVDAV
jgi:hypothetical protein